MKTRVTQNHLLILIIVLLAANLFLGRTPTSSAHDQAAAPVHDVLKAKQIELVAANGAVVAQLYTGEDGAGNIRLRSAKGEVRVKLGATEEGAGLILMNQSTEPAASLSVAPAQVALRLTQAKKGTRVFAP